MLTFCYFSVQLEAEGMFPTLYKGVNNDTQ